MDNGLTDKTIRFKETADGEVQKIPSEQLARLTYYDEDTICYCYERMSTFNLLFRKKVDAPKWYSVLVSGEHLSLYSEVITDVSYTTPRTIIHTYYCKRKDEPVATCLYQKADRQVGTNGMFKQAATKYFADHPELVEKIKNKDYTYRDLAEIVAEYNKWKSIHL